jgi:hypothetical protein
VALPLHCWLFQEAIQQKVAHVEESRVVSDWQPDPQLLQSLVESSKVPFTAWEAWLAHEAGRTAAETAVVGTDDRERSSLRAAAATAAAAALQGSGPARPSSSGATPRRRRGSAATPATLAAPGPAASLELALSRAGMLGPLATRLGDAAAAGEDVSAAAYSDGWEGATAPLAPPAAFFAALREACAGATEASALSGAGGAWRVMRLGDGIGDGDCGAAVTGGEVVVLRVGEKPAAGRAAGGRGKARAPAAVGVEALAALKAVWPEEPF